MKIIDVCSKPCPQPVIETKNAIDEDPRVVMKVIVNDEAARVNVSRFANSKGYSIKENLLDGGITELVMTPHSEEIETTEKEQKETERFGGDMVFLLKSYDIGTPDKELGSLLVKTFFQTLPDISPLPGKIIFMHGGVKHTVEGARCLELLKDLQKLGIEIVVCGTCLDYYNMKDKIKVGRISNFFEITSILNSAKNTVTI